MTALATPEDVALLLQRPLTDGELALAPVLLEVASGRLRLRVATIDARITAGTLPAVLASHVAAMMVVRFFQARGTDAPIENHVGPFAQRWAEGKAGEFTIEPDELDMLLPASGRPRTVSIGLGITPP